MATLLIKWSRDLVGLYVVKVTIDSVSEFRKYTGAFFFPKIFCKF